MYRKDSGLLGIAKMELPSGHTGVEATMLPIIHNWHYKNVVIGKKRNSA
jgi:hypothetical protein